MMTSSTATGEERTIEEEDDLSNVKQTATSISKTETYLLKKDNFCNTWWDFIKIETLDQLENQTVIDWKF